MKRLGLLVAVVAGGGCQDAPDYRPDVERVDGVAVARLSEIPPSDTPHLRWVMEELAAVSTQPDGDDPTVFDPTVAIELSSGDLFVHDAVSEGRLVVLEPSSGDVRARFGRSGEGPGELGSWLQLSESDDGSLEVLDPRNRQRHRFSVDGVWLGSDPVDLQGHGGKLRDHPAGRGYLVETFRRDGDAWRQHLVQWEEDGTTRPLFALPEPAPGAEPGRIQHGRVLWTQVGDVVVSMWSSRPEYFIHDLDGELLREVKLPWERRTIREADIQEQVEEYGEIATSLRVGPAALTNEFFAVSDSVFGMFQSDIWRPEGDPSLPPGRAIWRLFSVTGSYLGVFELPEDFWPLGRVGDTLWIRSADEAGVPVLQKMRLVPESTVQ